MAIILNSSLNDPYYGDKRYILINMEAVNFNGENYTKKTYQKNKERVRQIGEGALAFLATASIIPIIINKKGVKKLWVETQVSSKIKTVMFPSVILSDRQRRTPPCGKYDTVLGDREGIRSVHGTADFFDNEEIIHVSKFLYKKTIDSVDIYYSEHKKAILQQQSIRGCTAAVSAMLVLDHQRKPVMNELRCRNLGNTELEKRDLENSGLQHITTFISIEDPLSELRQALLSNGSAIVSVGDTQLGNHAILVDEVSEDLRQVRLRDPYHGWEITVTGTAFLKRFHSGEVIQVHKPNFDVSSVYP